MKGQIEDDIYLNNSKLLNTRVEVEEIKKVILKEEMEKENDKDNKIKFNKKNIFDYLNMKNKDLWESDLNNIESNKSELEGDLLKLKDLNIKIKEILFFYYYLIGKNDEGFEENVKAYIEIKKKEAEKERKRKEKLEMESKNFYKKLELIKSENVMRLPLDERRKIFLKLKRKEAEKKRKEEEEKLLNMM